MLHDILPRQVDDAVLNFFERGGPSWAYRERMENGRRREPEGVIERVSSAVGQFFRDIWNSTAVHVVRSLIGRVAVWTFHALRVTAFIVAIAVVIFAQIAKKALQYITTVLVVSAIVLAIAVALVVRQVGVFVVPVVITPFLATRRVIDLNYTLLHYKPSFAAALKANMLFWKGHIYDWFLAPQEGDWSMWGSYSREKRFKEIAQRAYAEMLVTALPDNFVRGQEGRLWRNEMIGALTASGVRLTRFDAPLPYDLVPMNNLGDVMRMNHLQALALAPLRPRDASRALVPQAVNQNPQAMIEIPRDIRGEPATEFHEEAQDPKYASKNVRKDYFQYRVPSIEIPPLPQNTDLRTLLGLLWSHIDRTWPVGLQMNDDNSWYSKNELSARIGEYYGRMDEMRQFEELGASPETLSTIKNALGSVLLAFLARRAMIDAMEDPRKKEKALETWSLEGRSFFMSLGRTLHHCIDRKLDDAYIFYVRFVERKPISYDELDSNALEKSLSDLLKEYRQDLVRHACTNLIETNMHHVSTERYVYASLNGELGLGFPGAFAARDALSSYAKKDKVAEVRQLFYRMYTPQSVTRHLIAEIKKASAVQDKKRNLYLKIVEWFERQNPVQHAADVFDVEKNEFREEAMMTLLEKMRVIQ
jgi:hypothetical protein